MASKLATALKTVLSERNLADNLGEAAKKIGVAYPSLKKILDGDSKPNKATAGKYQSFLGIEDEDFANLLGLKAEKSDDAPKLPKPAKRGKATVTRGRPAGRPSATETEEVPPQANTEAQPDDAEKDVTRAIAPTTEASFARRTAATEASIDRALAALDAVLKDDLALRVHAAPAGVRALIVRILG